MSKLDLRIRVLPAIGDIAAAEWDACANPASTNAANRFSGLRNCAEPFARDRDVPPALDTASGVAPVADAGALHAAPFNPFIAHDFLSALEASGSAVARAGWQPQHLVAETEGGTVLGVAPCYLKSHSRGEYVFDHGWAEAYERAGGSYYPKLQVAVPFTPATGRRLLVRPGADTTNVQAGLAAGLVELTRLRDASSAHLTFLTEAEWRFLGAQNFLQRTDQQFHWENRHYATFDDFTGALAARKRKVIRRERRDALPDG